jgi:hypothetical protein
VLNLVEWDGSFTAADEARAIALLRNLEPALTSLDRSQLRAELRISIAQWQPTNVLHFSASFVAAVAASRLNMGPAITCVDLGEDEDINLDQHAATTSGAEHGQVSALPWGLAVRVWGALPTVDALERELGTSLLATSRLIASETAQPVEQPGSAFAIPLTPREELDKGRLSPESTSNSVLLLERLTPGLTTLGREGGRAELHAHFVCKHYEDGFDLPADLIAHAASAVLEFDLLTMWPPEEEDTNEEADADADDVDDPEVIAGIQQRLDESTRKWWNR